MALETAGSFNPSIQNDLGYTGLIQIGDQAAKDINRRKGTNITTDDLKIMKAEDQLTYVGYYLEPYKGKLNTLTDFYLAILMPVDVGKGSEKDYAVFDNTTTLNYGSNGKVKKDVNYVRKYGYDSNPAFKQKTNEDGKTYVWEITAQINKWQVKGLGNKYDYSLCDNIVNVPDADIVSYHIYQDGKIEKHIPQNIKKEFKSNYKYVFHDADGIRKNICVLDVFKVAKRLNGEKISEVKSGYVDSYNYPIGGNAQKAYVYENGDIIAEGTKYGIRKYPKGAGDVELVKMPGALNIKGASFTIIYSFADTQRRYCNADCFAGFIGAIANSGLTTIKSTGMCFADATSYPSVSHPNGDSVDIQYLDTLEKNQKIVDAFKLFNFTKPISGTTTFSGLKNTTKADDHNDHLHFGDFDSGKIIIIKK